MLLENCDILRLFLDAFIFGNNWKLVIHEITQREEKRQFVGLFAIGEIQKECKSDRSRQELSNEIHIPTSA